MKKIALLIVISLLVVSCKNEKTTSEKQKHSHNDATEKVEKTKKKPLSPHTSAMAMVGDAHVHIDYSSPGVRGRIIFGGLLAYDQVWQAGAHKATWLETNKDLIIEGKTIAAGKYGLFTIPSKEKWTIILNSNWDQHGKDEYDEKDDVIRFKVTPVVSDEVTEHLKYEIKKTSEGEGTISLSWEKVTVSFPFKIK